MAFTGKMQLGSDSNEIVVLYAGYELEQPVDSQSRPSGMPRPNVLNVVVESSKDNRLIEWMVSPLMTKSIKIIFYGGNGATIKTIELDNAYCIGYKENFDHSSTNPMTIALRLVASNETANGDKKDDVAVTKYEAEELPPPTSPLPPLSKEATKDKPQLEENEPEQASYKIMY